MQTRRKKVFTEGNRCEAGSELSIVALSKVLILLLSSIWASLLTFETHQQFPHKPIKTQILFLFKQ